MITAPGIYPELRSDYHKGRLTPTRALTYSGIKILRDETPLDFITPRAKKSAAMDFGSIVHKLALDHGDEFTISPFDEFRTKEARAWRDEALESGATIIKAADLAEAEEMADVIRRKIKAVCGGHEYLTEVPFFWQEEETWCSGMMDVWCPDLNLIIDPKVTARVTDNLLPSHMHAQGWPLQAAWYKRGIGKIDSDREGRVHFVNLMIKPDAPYTSRMIEISEGWRTAAEMQCLRALGVFNRCMETGTWPGYPEEIEYLDAPVWAIREAMDDEMENGND